MSSFYYNSKIAPGAYRVQDSMSPRYVTITRSAVCGWDVVPGWDWPTSVVPVTVPSKAAGVQAAHEMIEDDRWSKAPGGRP